jgi:hypothetical protein
MSAGSALAVVLSLTAGLDGSVPAAGMSAGAALTLRL